VHLDISSSTVGVRAVPAPRAFAWVVFALTFGLLLSDYMSRQVLNAVFPLLKAEWHLSDTQLGSLGGVVALMVGLLTFPLSVLADRWGRVRCLTLMAILWCLATLGCGLARSYGQMFAARFVVGVGEAAYGSVGLAVILSVFPASLRSTLSGAFMAGGMFGSVLGMSAGGTVAAHFGWRWAFASVALFGLVLALLYPAIVSEQRLGLHADPGGRDQPAAAEKAGFAQLMAWLFSSRAILCAYVGSGLQLFIAGALLTWLPSFLNRYYGMATDRAGVTSAGFVLIGGIGMVVCGAITDHLSRKQPLRKLRMAILFCLISCVLLTLAFRLPFGNAQLLMISLGLFFAAGTAGPASAMVANLTPVAIHATALATLTLANSLLGLAPGPAVTGMVADRMSLLGALQLLPLIGLASGTVFLAARRYYSGDLARVGTLSGYSCAAQTLPSTST
jgi:MFS family permease